MTPRAGAGVLAAFVEKGAPAGDGLAFGQISGKHGGAEALLLRRAGAAQRLQEDRGAGIGGEAVAGTRLGPVFALVGLGEGAHAGGGGLIRGKGRDIDVHHPLDLLPQAAGGVAEAVGAAGADHHARLPARLPHGAEEGDDIAGIGAVQHHPGPRRAELAEQRAEIRGAGRKGQADGEGDAACAQPVLLGGGDALPIGAVLRQDGDAQGPGVGLPGGGETVGHGIHREAAEFHGARAAAEDEAGAARGQCIGDGAELEIGRAQRLGHLGGGQGQGGDGGPEDAGDPAFPRGQAADLAHRLGLVRGVAAQQPDLAPGEAARLVALVRRHLQPAIGLVAHQREGPGEGKEGTEAPFPHRDGGRHGLADPRHGRGLRLGGPDAGQKEGGKARQQGTARGRRHRRGNLARLEGNPAGMQAEAPGQRNPGALPGGFGGKGPVLVHALARPGKPSPPGLPGARP